MNTEEILEREDMRQTVEKLRRLVHIARRIGDYLIKTKYVDYIPSEMYSLGTNELVDVECNIAVDHRGPVPRIVNESVRVWLCDDFIAFISNSDSKHITLWNIKSDDLYTLAVYEEHCRVLEKIVKMFEDRLRKKKETIDKLQRLAQLVQQIPDNQISTQTVYTAF